MNGFCIQIYLIEYDSKHLMIVKIEAMN